MKDTIIKQGVGNVKKGKRKELIFLCGMLAIPVIHFFVFWLYVNIESILLAFQNRVGNFNNGDNFRWVFKNFASANPAVNMSQALINTIIFWAFNTFVEIPIAFMIAYFFFKKITWHKGFNVILYLPSILSAVVMTTVFKAFIASSGPMERLATIFGATGIPKFLYDDRYAMGTLLFYNLWTGFGINIILFSGSMARIPEEIFESAKLDGINTFKELTHIILPLIWQLFSTILILSIASIFSASGPILLFTKGEYGTMTIAYAMFQQYYEYAQIERAAAIGLVFTLAGAPLILLSRYLLSKVGSDVEY